MHYHNNLDIKIKHNIDKSFKIDYHLASNNNNHTSKYMNTQNPLWTTTTNPTKSKRNLLSNPTKLKNPPPMSQPPAQDTEQPKQRTKTDKHSNNE